MIKLKDSDMNFLEKLGLIGYIGLVGFTDVDKIMDMDGIAVIVFFIVLFVCWIIFLFGKGLLNEKQI